METEKPQNKQLEYQAARQELVGQLLLRMERGEELENKVFLVPGGNRVEGSIGGAITLALAMKGATVIIPHLHDTDDTKLQIKELETASIEDLGGGVVAMQADITDPNSRASLFHEIKETYGRLDGIFFLPAGGIRGTDEEAELLNVKAPVETARLYANMFGCTTQNEGALFVTLPSTPSKYLSLPLPIDRYGRTAKTKHQGDDQLDKMSEELSAVGIQRVSLVAGPVFDSNAMNLMMRKMSEEQIAQLHVKSNTNGEKRAPMRVDVAISALNLALNGARPGQVEFIGVHGLDRPQISETLYMYRPDKLLLDDFMRSGENEGVATMKVTAERIIPTFTADEIELIDENTARVTITDKHVAGHFDQNSGLPGVLRGVDQIAAGLIAGAKMEMARIKQISRDKGQNLRVVLGGIFGPVQFEGVARPGDILEIKSDAGDLKGSFYAEETTVSSKGIEIANFDTILGFWEKINHNESLPREQLIEAAAQTLGLLYAQTREMSDRLPLFKSINDIDFVDDFVDLQVGQTIEFRATLTRSGKSLFEGDAEFFVDGEKKGHVNGIHCKVQPKERITEILAGAVVE